MSNPTRIVFLSTTAKISQVMFSKKSCLFLLSPRRFAPHRVDGVGERQRPNRMEARNERASSCGDYAGLWLQSYGLLGCLGVESGFADARPKRVSESTQPALRRVGTIARSPSKTQSTPKARMSVSTCLRFNAGVVSSAGKQLECCAQRRACSTSITLTGAQVYSHS